MLTRPQSSAWARPWTKVLFKKKNVYFFILRQCLYMSGRGAEGEGEKIPSRLCTQHRARHRAWSHDREIMTWVKFKSLPLNRWSHERGPPLISNWWNFPHSVSSRKEVFEVQIQLHGQVLSSMKPWPCWRSLMVQLTGPAGARSSGGEVLHILDFRKVSKVLSYKADMCSFTNEKMGTQGS